MKKIVNKILLYLPLLFFIYIFGILMGFALNDPDIWWHLKTGEYILDNKELPGVRSEDPFSFTIPLTLGIGKRLGMMTQWLGQVIYYLPYKLDGLFGVVILRNILIISSMLILFLWLVRKGLNTWLAIVVIGTPLAFLSLNLFYSFERPQGFSFLFSLIVVLLIDNLRSNSSASHPLRIYNYFVLPLIMLLWANVHAGFVIGDIIICIYISVELLKVIVKILKLKEKNASNLKHMFLSQDGAGPNIKFITVAALSVLASFFNPNSYKIFWAYASGMFAKFSGEMIQYVTTGSSSTGGWVEDVVLEYKSLWYFYKFLGYDWLILYWIFIGLSIFFMVIKFWQKRKIDFADMLVVCFVSVFGSYYARGIMFSLTIIPFYLGKTLIEFPNTTKIQRNLLNSMFAVVFALFLGFGIFTYKTSPYLLEPRISEMWVSPWYPGQLTEFVKTLKIPGPMYNFYTWGGFLIFKMYPDYKVFIDGRAIDDTVNKIADGILKTFPGWESQLDAYGINFIVIPVIFRESGHVIPLSTALVYNNKWKLIYVRNNGAVFVRDVPQNQQFIYRFNTNKNAIYEEIINIENILLSGSQGNPIYNVSKADALFALGYYKEAKDIYARFPEISTDRLNSLKNMGY